MKSVSDYHFSNANAGLLHGFFRKCANDYIPANHYPTILDIGCGNGSLCRYLKDRGHQVSGLEPSPQGYGIAIKTHLDIDFYNMGIEDPLPEKLKPVDAIICTEVVEHLFSPRNLPSYIKSILKPNGRVIITTPYHGWLKNSLISLSGKWDSHHNPLWDYGHIKFWSPATLRILFEEQGFMYEDFRTHGRIPGLWKTMAMVFTLPPSPNQ